MLFKNFLSKHVYSLIFPSEYDVGCVGRNVQPECLFALQVFSTVIMHFTACNNDYKVWHKWVGPYDFSVLCFRNQHCDQRGGSYQIRMHKDKASAVTYRKQIL